MDERNQLVYLDEEQGSEFPLTEFEGFEGGWWESPLRMCAQQGQTREKRGAHDGPAGPIRDVLEVRPPAGEYTVHAWLTTMGDAPLFAAAAPVTVQ